MCERRFYDVGKTEITRFELGLLNNSLRYVIAHIPGDEFERRFGATPQDGAYLLIKLRDLFDS